MSTLRSIIGLDIGGSKIACVEGTPDGETLGRVETPMDASRPFEFAFPEIVSLLEERRASATKGGRDVIALSVAVGGPLRIKEGILGSPPHLPAWRGVHLKEQLAAAFPTLPVCIEHDANAGALAELYFGVGRLRPGIKNLIFLTFGTGLGAGLIVNGAIVHGASDTAGEIGHWRMSLEGPTAYGKRGALEAYASGSGFVQLAYRRFPHRWSLETPVRLLVEAMLANDSDALAVAREAGEWLGRGLALLIDALNPEVIVLGSLAVALGDRVLEPARRIVAEEALPEAAAACDIVPTVLGARIGDVASLMAALTDPGVSQYLRAGRLS